MNNHQQIESECTYLLFGKIEWGRCRDQGGGLVGMESLKLGWGDSDGVIIWAEGVASRMSSPLKHTSTAFGSTPSCFWGE